MKMDKTIQDYKYIFYLPSYQKNSNGIVSIWEAAYYFSKYRDTSILITDVQTNLASNKNFHISNYIIHIFFPRTS